MRIGQSVDIHKLVLGRKLILGGVTIESDLGLLGHSDADVLLHAIIEAIIGAMGLGDIGTHFPDTSSEFKDISSMILLEQTYDLMRKNNYEVVNVDSIIMIEQPKIAPYIFKMRGNIARMLNCEVSQINVKATRGEGLGFVGERKGVQAQAVVLLDKRKDRR